MKIIPKEKRPGIIQVTKNMLFTFHDIQEACIKLGYDNHKMLDELTRLYIPWDDAVTEFQIEYTDFSLSQSKGVEYALRPFKSPSLILVLQGNGTCVDSNGNVVKLGKNGHGCVFYLNDPTTGLAVVEDMNSDDRLILVRACERRENWVCVSKECII